MVRVWLGFLCTLAAVANITGFVLLLGDLDPAFKQTGLVTLFGGQALLAFLVGYPLLFGWAPHPRVNAARGFLAILMVITVLMLFVGIALTLGWLGVGTGVIVAIGVLLTLLVVLWIASVILAVR